MCDFGKTIAYTVTILFLMFVLVSPLTFANEGTRHITGNDVDIYFMNDKVFGTVSGYPLWAIYNCGKDINGEMSHNGNTREFSFLYNHQGNPLINGSFGNMQMSLDGIKRQNNIFP